MTPVDFIQRLKWRQILIHFVAAWFFLYAFQTLAFLYNVRMYDALSKIANANGKSSSFDLKGENFTIGEAITYFYYATATWFVGLIVAMVISLRIAKKRKWFWVNSLVVFLIIIFLKQQELLGWSFLKKIFLSPGEIFKGSAYYTTLYLLTNGLLLLAAGIFIFFNKKINEFIDNKDLMSKNFAAG